MININQTKDEKGNATIRVIRSDVLATVSMGKIRNPLKYIQDYENGKYRKELVQQLIDSGLSEHEIQALIRPDTD